VGYPAAKQRGREREMQYEGEAKQILDLVGGKGNVRSLVHCATRLRFELKDEPRAAANKEALEKLPYVLKVIQSGGQFQVVIGPKVHDYWMAMMEVGGLSEDGGTRDDTPAKKQSPLNAVLKFFSGSFSPIIPLMSGAGMLKALLTLFVTLGWLVETSSTYLVLAAAANSCFYFLPIILGYTSAKQLKVDPWVGAAIGGALLEPNFVSLVGQSGTTFLSLGLTAVDYSSTVFPIFITVVIYSFLDRGLRKIINSDLQLFLVPMISLMVMVPFAALVFGPFGVNVGNAIAAGIQWLFNTSKFFAGLVLGALYPYLVILGLHWGLAPISLQNITLSGGDYIEGSVVCACWAQMGIALGCYLKAKKGSKVRDVAGPSFITGIMAGVTEPILYGLVTNYKRLMIIVSIASGLGAAWNAMFGVTMNAYVFHNIFSVATLCYSPMWAFLVGILISITTATLLTYFWQPSEDEMRDFVPAAKIAPTADVVAGKPAGETTGVEIDFVAPADGRLVRLIDVRDQVFASGAIGRGYAVVPSGDTIYSPCDGTLSMVFATKHALGITTAEGLEVLVHIGMDTVELRGEGFTQLVEQGAKIKAGQPLMKLDRTFFDGKGICLDTPVVITNPDSVQSMSFSNPAEVKHGDPAMRVIL